MTGFILNYDFKDNSAIQVEAGIVKYWEGFGLPVFEGDLEGFDRCYPKHMQELIAKKIVIKTGD